jgi:hypothetical protein
MRGNFCRVLALITGTGLVLPIAGQVPGSTTPTGMTANPAHTAHLPYTAEFKVTNVRVLANGSTITLNSILVAAADSDGRQATATTATRQSRDMPRATRINVFDPVAHINVNWSSPGQKATVTEWLASVGPPPSCPPSAPNDARVPVKSMPGSIIEDLGTQTIRGIEAHGRRITTTLQTGTLGNDKPLVYIREFWTAIAPKLDGLNVREITIDPQAGKTTKELIHFKQSDPDPATFQPPHGYEVVARDAPVIPPPCGMMGGAIFTIGPLPAPPKR